MVVMGELIAFLYLLYWCLVVVKGELVAFLRL